MRRFISILFFALTLSLVSYRTDNDLETEKYLNFLAAVQNASTFNYFTVVTVKNLNTGETKEICTKGNFVSGALHTELKAGFDTASQRRVFEFAKARKNRYFEFRNKKALDNISFFDYNPKLVTAIQKEYNFDKVVELIKKDKEFGVMLPHGKMEAFAHVLFNRGYMTGESSCWGGTLEYVDRNKAD
jgi:hypothetical protein